MEFCEVTNYHLVEIYWYPRGTSWLFYNEGGGSTFLQNGGKYCETTWNHLHLPQSNLTIYQKGAYYSGIKIFNKLPLEFKNTVGNQKKFKTVLKKFLLNYSFYTIEEYFDQLWIWY